MEIILDKVSKLENSLKNARKKIKTQDKAIKELMRINKKVY